MATTPTLKSTQVIAGVAIVIALLGGAYAVGRSHNGGAPEPLVATAPVMPDTAPAATAAPAAALTPAPTPAPAPVQQQQPPREALLPPQRVAAADLPMQAQPVEAPRPVAICQSCGRVTDVHTESRHGKASGVGAVGGAVVGGLLGNMVGGGNGRKLATVAGAVGGGYAGNQIEKNQKSYTVWIVQVEQRDGRIRRFERSNDPGVQVGDEVRLTDNGFTHR